MDQVLLIGALILLYTFQSLFSKLYTDAYPGDKEYAPACFAIVCGGIVAVVSLIFTGGVFGPFKWETLLFGLVNAAVLYCYDEFIIKASAAGDYSIMMVFNLGGGIVIPSVVSLMFFNAPFLWLQLVAIAIICVAVYLVSYKKTEAGAGGNGKKGVFLILCSLLAVSNGLYGVILNWQDFSYTGGNANIVNADKQLVVIYTFIGAAIISAVRLAIRKRGESLTVFRQNKKSLLHLILASVVSALAVNVLVILISKVNITLLYTFDNAGVMLMSAIASALLFREKLTKLNIVGCVIMVVGLILMGGAEPIQGFIEGLFTPAA